MPVTLDSALSVPILSHSQSAGWRIPLGPSSFGVSFGNSRRSGSLQTLGKICRYSAFQYSSLGTQCSSFIAFPGSAGFTWGDCFSFPSVSPNWTQVDGEDLHCIPTMCIASPRLLFFSHLMWELGLVPIFTQKL